MWREDHASFKDTQDVVLKIITDFNQIPDAPHKAAVISGLSLFYLALADENFEIFKNFVIANLQDPDGRVREAARKTGDWLYISLTSRAEIFVYPEDTPLSEKQVKIQAHARKQYVDLVTELERLIDEQPDVDTEDEYIDEMKPSVHKSLQLFWCRFTDSPLYRRIREKERAIPIDIFLAKKDIEARIETSLKKLKSVVDLEWIKQIIYQEDGTSDLMEVIAIFYTGKSDAELQEALDLANDAWNYFPHKKLGGLSPFEKLQEYKA